MIAPQKFNSGKFKMSQTEQGIFLRDSVCLNRDQPQIYVRNIVEGNNSVLFEANKGFILYEKLSNTIHFGDRDSLRDLQRKVETLEYNPVYESESLKKSRGKKLDALVFNVTESCNLACSYCIYSGNYENERTETKSDMSFETAKKAVNLFMPLSKEHSLVSFYGGEPLNNMDLILQTINYIKKEYPQKQVTFSMTSNFCDADKFIKELIENGIYINMSLDGPKQIHNKNRKFKDGRPTHDKIMRNLQKFKEISPEYVKTHISQNITYESLDNLPDIIRFFQENEDLTISRVSSVESKGLKSQEKKDNPSDLFTLSSDYVEAILNGNNSRIHGFFFNHGLRQIALRSTETMPENLMLDGCCYPSNRKLFVDTKGKFYICEKFGDRISIGDIDRGINRESIDDAIDKFTEIRNNLCTNGCWSQRLCRPCIQAAKDPQGDISERGLAQMCNSNKSQILMAIANYVLLTKKDKIILEDYVKSIKFK